MKYKSSEIFFSLSLLTLFVICSAMVILYQMQGYQKIVQRNEISETQHLPLAYLHERLTHLEKQSSYHIINMDGIDVLWIENPIQETSTYLYVYDGSLRELNVVQDTQVNLAQGETLTSLDAMQIREQDQLLIITCTLHETSQELQIWKRT